MTQNKNCFKPYRCQANTSYIFNVSFVLDSEEHDNVTEKKGTLIELKKFDVNEEEERVDKLLLNCPSPPGK